MNNRDKELVEKRISMHMEGKLPKLCYVSEVGEAIRRKKEHKLMAKIIGLRNQAWKLMLTVTRTREKLEKQEARLKTKKEQIGNLCQNYDK